MDDGFYTAFTGGGGRLLGRRVRPFSHWHALLLSAIESPVLLSPNAVSMDNVLIALRVCGTKWPDIPNLGYTIPDAGQKLLAKWRPARLHNSAGWLGEYLSEFTSRPEFYLSESAKNGEGFTAPPLLSTVSYLIGKGFTEERAWNMSLGEASWYEATLLERDGAKLRFSYEEEATEEEELTEEEILDNASAMLPPSIVDEWIAKRTGGEVC